MAGRASIPSLRASRRRLLGQGSGAEGAAPVLTVKPPAGPCNAPIPWHRDSAPTPGGLGEATAGIPMSVLRAVHGAAAPRAARAHGTAVAPPAVGATLLQFVPAWGSDDGGGRWRAEGFAWGGKLLGGGRGAGAGSLNGSPQRLGPQCCSCGAGASRTQGDALMVRSALGPGPVLGMLVPGPELRPVGVSPALSVQHPPAMPGAKFSSKHSGGEGGEAARVAFCRAAGDWGTGAQ